MANLPVMSIRYPSIVFILMVIAMATVSSKAMMNIGLFFLVLMTLLEVKVKPFRVSLYIEWQKVRQSIRANPQIWIFSLFWFLYFVSIIYAGDLSAWWKLTHPKFIFLLLPLCFALLGPVHKNTYMLIAICMVIMTVWASIWIQLAYFSNFYLFNQSLGFGSSLPVPGSHIRYSTIVAISMIICTGFFIEKWNLKYKWERWVYGGAAIYLFYFLHILSVRTGLLVGYAGIFILAIFYIRKLLWWKQLALIGIMIAIPAGAIMMLPGLQMKARYTMYDLTRFLEDQGDAYSDSQRWESWRAGLTLGNQNPIFGTGTGHFRAKLKEYYEARSKPYTWRPLNQLIHVFAIFGLFGLTIFLIVIIYPMTFSFFWKTPFIPTLYIAQLVSFVAEHPLDTEVGTYLFLLLSLLGLSYQKSQISN